VIATGNGLQVEVYLVNVSIALVSPSGIPERGTVIKETFSRQDTLKNILEVASRRLHLSQLLQKVRIRMCIGLIVYSFDYGEPIVSNCFAI